MQKFFININRSGGRVISKNLGIPLQFVTAKEFIEVLGRDAWDNGFKFSCVRNPWDRAFVIYQFHISKRSLTTIKPEIEFNHWIKEIFVERNPQYYENEKYFMPQVNWLKDDFGEIRLDHIARFERIDKEIELLSRMLDISPSEKEFRPKLWLPYRDYYSTESIAIVGKWFEEDVEHFKYSY